MRRYLKSLLFVVASLLILLLGQMYLLEGVPPKTGGEGTHEIIIDTLDLGGDPTPGYVDMGNNLNLIYSAGEPGGINRLTGGGTHELQAGYLGQDLVSPSSITVFSATAVGDGRVTMTWTATGDDLNIGTLLAGSRFHISSTTLLANATTNAYWLPTKRDNAEVRISTGGISPGTVCSITITGLRETTYYFRIWTLDQGANWSDISVGATVFALVTPGVVTDLAAVPGVRGRTIDLNWTAPGDDGYIGTLIAGSRFAIQRSTWSGVAWSTGSVDTVLISTHNVNPGDRQRHTLTNLVPGATYFIAIWTSDEMGNWSIRSSTASTWAQVAILSVTIAPKHYDFGLQPTAISTNSATATTVENTGNVNQTYRMRATHSDHWSLSSSSSAGQNIFVLRSAYHGTRPSIDAFTAQDNIMALTDKTSSGTVFTIDGSVTASNIDPFANDVRNLWLRFDTPLMTSTSAQQTITVTITAIEP